MPALRGPCKSQPAIKAVVALIAASLSACTATWHSRAGIDENLLIADFPQLPADARSVARRLASCSYYYGEIGGDARRDRKLMKFLADLRCNIVDEDAVAIRAKYPADKAVQNSLDPTMTP